jgi:CcmD family protein
MDSNFLWLVAAGAAVWLGLAAYLIFMGCAQRRLDARLRQMEILHD